MHQPCFPPYLPPCAKVDSSAYNAFSPDVHVSSMVFPVVAHACAHILSCFSRVRLCATLWTVVCQGPLSLGFSKQEYWSGPSSRGSSQPRDQTCVFCSSYTARRIFATGSPGMPLCSGRTQQIFAECFMRTS